MLRIIKIGGNIIDNPAKLQAFLKAFALLDGPKILVHGGGKIASEFGEKLGIRAKMHNGRRITDRETLDLVTMVYAGLINKNIVAGLQANQCNAIGLSGADANSLLARKRPIKEVDFGFVGDVVEGGVQNSWIKTLLDSGLCPVFCPITHDGTGCLLNTNADTIASQLAVAMAGYGETELIYCFEKKGVLSNVDDDDSVIHEINRAEFNKLLEQGIIADGMIPKLENALHSVERGVKQVRIMDASELGRLSQGLPVGTVIL
jgi:acetylglutamate kinase